MPPCRRHFSRLPTLFDAAGALRYFAAAARRAIVLRRAMRYVITRQRYGAFAFFFRAMPSCHAMPPLMLPTRHAMPCYAALF